jgi:hypothetical protein
MANFCIGLLIILALPWVFFNTSRPIIGMNNIFTTSRNQLYFSKRPTLADTYFKSAQIISDNHCSNVGLVMGEDDWEYPLWVLLQERIGKAVNFEHVDITNISKKVYSGTNPLVENICSVFSVNADPPETLMIGSIKYLRDWSSGPYNVYIRVLSP